MNLKRGLIFVVTQVIALGFMAGCGGSRTVDLSMEWSEGSVYEYVQTIDQTIEQDLKGQKQTFDQVFQRTYRYEVKGISDDGITVKTTIKGIKQKQSMKGRTMKYDSNNPEQSNHPASSMLQSIVGGSFDIIFAKNGSVKDVKRLSDYYDRMEGLSPQAKTQMKKQFGKEAIKQMINRSFMVHTDEERSVGDEWSHKVSLTKPMPMVVESQYKLKKISQGEATIEVTSDIKPNEKAGSMKMRNRTVEYNIKGSQVGEIIYDLDNKFVKSVKYDQDFDGNMMMEGGRTDSQQIPLKITGTFSMEGEKIQ